ncbi:hypothetical protein [Halomonas organivorans]|uniref:Uncharacterized protein n=1 Tax=Halomonas organivorans TaxID=257772 RepID=A0A7W5BY01_9GAMM|nr:hypothetical protein [Halomonas organivorans]MBB3141235.1 hypothetical protein [Halomonas organivorans]
MIVRIPGIPNLDDDRSDKLRVIEHAINAFGEGKHILWMQRALVEMLLDTEGLSDYHYRALYKLKSYVRESKYLHESFVFHVEIDFDDKMCRQVEDGRFLRVGYGWLNDSSFWQKAKIIVEHVFDYQLYLKGSQVFLVKAGLFDSQDVKCNPHHGGGATTYDEFVRHLNEDEPVLCIVDSDKSHPSGKLGGTAKRFNRFERGADGFGYLRILDSREVENIIPLDVVEEVILRTSQNNYDNFNIVARHGCRPFFDHKCGLRKDDALALDHQCGSVYWEGVVEAREDADDWVCRGIGSDLSRHSLDAMNCCSVHKLAERTVEGVDDEWLSISQLVASWGACLKNRVC